MSEVRRALEELPLRPDQLRIQRSARLLLLLQVAKALNLKKPIGLERLSYYDFFAANPFALFGESDMEAKELLLEGFSSFDLSYQSTGHRFVTRREQLQSDLAFIVARGLVVAIPVQRLVAYEVTEKGRQVSRHFASLYAQAYRTSATHVLRRLDRLNDAALGREARARLESTGQLISLYEPEGAERAT